MVRTLVLATFLLALLGAAGVWYSVTTDQWPGDDRAQPAKTVWAFNNWLGKFLYEHGQDTPEEIEAAKPRREGLTAAEQAEIKKAMANDPRLQGRLSLNAGGPWGGGGGSRFTPVFAPRRG